MATNGNKEQVLLRGQFTLYPKKKPQYNFRVTPTHIHWSSQDTSAKKTSALCFRDIIGCECMKGKTNSDTNAYLTVYAYPHTKKFASKKTVRTRHAMTLTFSEHNIHANNEKDALKWRDVLQCLIKKVPLSFPLDLSHLPVPINKKLLVLVNPFSGSGTALSLFQQRVVPIFAEANIHYHMIVTEYAGHARDLMHTVQLTEWGGVVIVSGDGLLFEVVNGLMEREDWAEAIKMPLGVLPGGSGNALCSALLHQAGEPYLENTLLHSTFSLVKHDVVPMDLVAVETLSGKRLYSFLAVAWGIISDVDIESEKYRSMGSGRFYLGAAVRIINLRSYHGRLSFLPVGQYHPGPLTRSHSMASPDPDIPRVITTQPHRSQSMVGDLPLQTEHKRRSTTLEAVSESVQQEDEPNAEVGLVKVDVEEEDSKVKGGFYLEDGEEGGGDAPKSTSERGVYGTNGSTVPTPLLRPLTEPVPDDWVTIDTKFIQVVAMYQSHLGKDFMAAPDIKYDDGIIYLAMTPETSRRKVLQQFTDFQEGNINQNPDVEVIKVKAFRLEPITKPGHMTVDGELVDYGPIQGQVLPSMARVMTLTQQDGEVIYSEQ